LDFPGKSTGVGCHCLLRFNLLYNLYSMYPFFVIDLWFQVGPGQENTTILWNQGGFPVTSSCVVQATCPFQGEGSE
jgi:hypothetical protein